jgi:DNA-directed RNA polymerase subunit RPC12/RpoP
MTTLKTVTEYNAEVKARREAMSKSGIQCPACEKSELRWSDENWLMSIPPKRNVVCPRCKWRGSVDA